tara:strand:+ start:4617 stop:5456 length:840 start_codon:yes stop_codon:yes gene_type:complete
MEEVLNILYEFLFAAPEGVNMGVAPLVAGALVSGVGKVIGGLFGAGRARRARRRAAAEKRRLKGELNSLEKSRQKIVNPYSNTKDLSSLAKDLSGNLSNPYGNLSVSTAGAAMQVEEADIALANTLDTLRATGASAGGATALAQAALQSKKGVAASIEAQEASNEKLRAQGEQYLQQAQIQEQRRLQNVDIQEGRRTQQADAMGKTFMFNAQERREDSKIGYTRQQITGAQQRETAAYNQGTKSMMGAIGGLTGMAAIGAVKAAGGSDSEMDKAAEWFK